MSQTDLKVKRAEPMHMWGQGVDGNSVSSTQFCHEPNTALKNKV